MVIDGRTLVLHADPRSMPPCFWFEEWDPDVHDFLDSHGFLDASVAHRREEVPDGSTDDSPDD